MVSLFCLLQKRRCVKWVWPRLGSAYTEHCFILDCDGKTKTASIMCSAVLRLLAAIWDISALLRSVLPQKRQQQYLGFRWKDAHRQCSLRQMVHAQITNRHNWSFTCRPGYLLLINNDVRKLFIYYIFTISPNKRPRERKGFKQAVKAY